MKCFSFFKVFFFLCIGLQIHVVWAQDDAVKDDDGATPLDLLGEAHILDRLTDRVLRVTWARRKG